MSSLAPAAVASDQLTTSQNRLVLVVYTAAIFVSALLLFSVQPLFTKMVLPRLGGSPAVWSVAMVFFQSLLLAGYAYAHWLQSRPARTQAILHSVFLAVSLFLLPIIPGDRWKLYLDLTAWGCGTGQFIGLTARMCG